MRVDGEAVPTRRPRAAPRHRRALRRHRRASIPSRGSRPRSAAHLVWTRTGGQRHRRGNEHLHLGERRVRLPAHRRGRHGQPRRHRAAPGEAAPTPSSRALAAGIALRRTERLGRRAKPGPPAASVYHRPRDRCRRVGRLGRRRRRPGRAQARPAGAAAERGVDPVLARAAPRPVWRSARSRADRDDDPDGVPRHPRPRGGAGVPVFQAGRGRYGIDRKFFLPPLRLSVPEAIVLFLASRLIAPLVGPVRRRRW